MWSNIYLCDANRKTVIQLFIKTSCRSVVSFKYCIWSKDILYTIIYIRKCAESQNCAVHEKLSVSKWLTCGNGLTLGIHGVILLAAGTHAQEGTIHVYTLSLSTYTAQQFTFVYICGEGREKRVNKCCYK